MTSFDWTCGLGLLTGCIGLVLSMQAHFFSVSDLDMIWRSVMHAHLFNSRFGEMIEFHTASCGSYVSLQRRVIVQSFVEVELTLFDCACSTLNRFNKRDFDELMHIHSNMASSRAASLGLSPVSTLKCCLILPCEASEEEIFRVGKHLHSLLKLQGSLYYRTLDDLLVVTPASAAAGAAASNSVSERPLRSGRSDLLNEDGKMTEDSFRRFARYRIKKEEVRDGCFSRTNCVFVVEKHCRGLTRFPLCVTLLRAV